MVKLSVVVPVYNLEDYVAKCLDSLLEPGRSRLAAGEEPGYEIIAVNDGSTDSSGDIAAEYRRRYPELIRLITIENRGQGQARNVGMDAAAGEWIVFLDADDLYESTYLETLLGREEKRLRGLSASASPNPSEIAEAETLIAGLREILAARKQKGE